MHKEQSGFGDHAVATLQANASIPEGMGIDGHYHVVCHDKDGNFKWEAVTDNLVVNVGLQDMNDKYFTGSTYTATWYIGLYGAASSNNSTPSWLGSGKSYPPQYSQWRYVLPFTMFIGAPQREKLQEYVVPREQ